MIQWLEGTSVHAITVHHLVPKWKGLAIGLVINGEAATKVQGNENGEPMTDAIGNIEESWEGWIYYD